jgi:hypothetical protein
MTSSMRMRVRHMVGVLAAVACLSALFAAPAYAEPLAWYKIVTGSRPTNLWVPSDNVQEIQVVPNEFFGAAAAIKVGGETVGCLGTGLAGEIFCPGVYGFPPTETASQLEAVLEGPLGPTVEVTGGPVGGEPFKVTVPGSGAPAITLSQTEPAFGSFKAKVLSAGGSGRLVVTVTNIGDLALDATKVPLAITDELPEGVVATGVEATAGINGSAGPVDCEVEAPGLVACSFNDTLPPFESVEIEVLANLTGEPPTVGSPGSVTVSGGDGPTESASQQVKVSSEKTPFGVEFFSAKIEEEHGGLAMAAGGHPFQLTTAIQFNAGQFLAAPSRELSEVEQPAQPRNLRFPLPAGFIGNATTVPTCSMAEFFERVGGAEVNTCPEASVIGATSVLINLKGITGFVRPAVPVFNLPPAAGEPARLGFIVSGAATIIDTEVDPDNEYRIIASVNNATQLPQILSTTLTIWGVPGDARHDNARGWGCVYGAADAGPCVRPADLGSDAFLRDPVSCVTAVDFGVEAEPWNVPIGSVVDRQSISQPHMSGCNQVPFSPGISASPTSKLAGSPSGLDVQLEMKNEGLLEGDAIAEGQAKKVEVVLPEGMTLNPSQGEGLVGCSPQDLAREAFDSRPGEGCPDASKVGEVKAATPLLKEEVRGSVYVASPFDNPFGSLIALYVVAKIPERGILIKQAGVVKPDSKTGQLTSIFDDIPQFPFTTLSVNFRAGARSSLVTPPACGNYDVIARFTPWSAKDPSNPAPDEVVTETSTFEIERGVNGAACPSGGTPPFHPGLNAGTINNAAKSYSPFNLRLTRKDGEQEFTNFSIKLPPGVIGKLAGIDVCSDAAIALAKSRTGRNGAQEELDSPSCPANSQVGRTLAGSGVGASLTYVPGKVYLAGPFNGAPLSMVAITAAKVGPFDLGTVVIRLALRIDPETAEVFVDPTGSDPLPHIIQGIEVHLRDIRAYVDRPEFVLNPTNCDRTSTVSTVLGSGLNFASAIDDEPVDVTSPFQAADCASLGFKPKLSLHLKGGTKRGDNPKLRAVMEPRPGDANIEKIQVTLPHSEFIEQSHFKTICTRVQFAAGAIPGEGCPKNSIYGYARVFTPLLATPIEGPVFLRSSNHPLPDLVLALHNDQINLNVDGRVDSVGNGRLRSTFELLPDAPVTKAVLNMQGGKKGLFVNSTDLCKRKHNVAVSFDGQNGKFHDFKTPLKPQCGKKSKKSKSRAR